ncbi:hypothetical protein HPB50_006977 [Hyalomma asiaticum]|uniref:Uncharacterized protein n=1 Tax=Hyalomma asiaticum TaxID=266040 RepID=A0ACB7TFN3_HYAAI|nr:hypothetical protein HPB50_006977 [Hyalomma asiaticum]
MTENIPKNMHPVHDAGRRRCRAEAFLRSHGRQDGVLFVDAARYPKDASQQGRSILPTFSVAVMDTHNNIRVTGSTKVQTSEAAEEMAIALAILHGTETDSLIISDAKTGIRNYRKGWISAGAARALNAKAKDFQDGTLSTKTLKWFPAHMGELNRQKPEIPDNLNERAHRVARRLTHRDTFRATDTNGVFRGDPVTGEQSYMTTAIQDNKDLMVTYHEILSHFRKQRQTYPRPHQQLDRSQATDLRCLQTHTFKNPAHLYTGYIRINIHHQPVLGAGTPTLT